MIAAIRRFFARILTSFLVVVTLGLVKLNPKGEPTASDIKEDERGAVALNLDEIDRSKSDRPKLK